MVLNLFARARNFAIFVYEYLVMHLVFNSAKSTRTVYSRVIMTHSIFMIMIIEVDYVIVNAIELYVSRTQSFT